MASKTTAAQLREQLAKLEQQRDRIDKRIDRLYERINERDVLEKVMSSVGVENGVTISPGCGIRDIAGLLATVLSIKNANSVIVKFEDGSERKLAFCDIKVMSDHNDKVCCELEDIINRAAFQ